VYKKASDYGVNIGIKSPNDIISLENEGIEQLGLVTVGDKKYVINNEVAKAIQDSNGDLKLNGNEILSRAKEQNSQGQFVPIKNSDGSFKYESTGTFMQPVENVFKRKTDDKRTKSSIGIATEMSPDENKYFTAQGIDPNTVSAEVLDTYRKENVKNKVAKEKDATVANTAISFIDDRLDPKSENAIVYGKPVSGKDIFESRKAQSKEAKMPSTKKSELSGRLSIYQSGADIIQYVAENKINFDGVETAKTEVTKLTGMSFDDIKDKILSKDNSELTDDEVKIKEKTNMMILSKITAETKIKNLIANYVKIISGAGVTNEERNMFYDIITAGKYSDEKALLTAMTSFVESIGDGYKAEYSSLKYEYPADYVTSVKAWNDADKTGIINKYRPTTKTETKQTTDTANTKQGKSYKDYM
jgi:hypothetical protein